jgi:hypothetical protein
MSNKKENNITTEIIVFFVFAIIGGVNVDMLFERFSFFSLVLVIISFIVIVSIFLRR